ncbi:hypothetical protein QFZ68_007385 [Streptomyces sp. V1I6]|nr:hypothetical protein [Streptomyces sp. V1I6]
MSPTGRRHPYYAVMTARIRSYPRRFWDPRAREVVDQQRKVPPLQEP